MYLSGAKLNKKHVQNRLVYILKVSKLKSQHKLTIKFKI